MISAENAEFEGATCPGRERCGGRGWRFDAASHFGSVFVDAHNERGKAGMAKAKRERGRARVVEGMRLETNGFGVGG